MSEPETAEGNVRMIYGDGETNCRSFSGAQGIKFVWMIYGLNIASDPKSKHLFICIESENVEHITVCYWDTSQSLGKG